MTDWRLLLTPPVPGPRNMAVDRALLESVRDGAPPALRFYRWRPPCLSFGRNQPARGRYNLSAIETRGIDIVRRPTGGRAVLHDHELTYAVAVPLGTLGSARESYDRIHRALVAGLRRLGVGAIVAGDEGGGRTIEGVCFQDAAPGEVVAGGRKLVGSAVRVQRPGLLQHGSLLLGGDQSLAAEVGAEPSAEPATLAALLDDVPAWPRLVSALRAGFRATLGIRFAHQDLSRTERARSEELAERFRSTAWTWRR